MGFTLSKTVTPLKTYPSLGGAALQIAQESIDVTYSAVSIISLSADRCTIRYSIAVPGGEMPGYGEHAFTYSGTGSPLDEGETSLQQSLENAS
ncbi:hypothetical protein [Klebsiella sp. 2019SCSN059]|uniref:hypothetical protein n=1 Tax=Klebsiella sp. 2019SCSN059 TaxID=2911173 RepID=UPI001F1DBB0B|nr:hypothetical protein [Klebsiella sp. 2019SCSN059]MCF8599111.1 hypothetical protein [Klebsiella sp. 2019SCSN059]